MVRAHGSPGLAGALGTGARFGSMARSRKAFWIKQFYAWHWVSSAICLFSMLLFAFTGIALNHAGQITGSPEVVAKEATLPASLLEKLTASPDASIEGAPLPAEIRQWIQRELDVSVGGRRAEWSDYDIYVGMPRPGGDAWLSIDRSTGEVLYEDSDRGWIAYLNDLHKGRDTGTVWMWFLDIFSGASILFCFTGLALLFVHARRRPMTWPVVISGIILPVLLAIIFIAH